MSDRKKLLILALMTVLLGILSGCGGASGVLMAAEGSVSELEQLAQEGILTPFDPELAVVVAPDLELYTVRIGTITPGHELIVTPFFPIQEVMRFERTEGFFSGMRVSQHNRVAANALVAELTFETEYLELQHQQLLLQYEQFLDNDSEQRARRQDEIDAARLTVELASDGEWEIQALRLAQMELRFEQFLYDSYNTRETWQERISASEENLVVEQIRTPFSGVISWTNANAAVQNRIAPDTIVRGHPNIATIIDDSVMLFRIETAHPRQFRFGDVFVLQTLGSTQVVLEARVVNDPLADGSWDRISPQQFILEPVNPSAFNAYLQRRGLSAYDLRNYTLRAFPNFNYAIDDVIIHRRAIHAEDQRNFVFLYEDGYIRKRYVVVGNRFGDQIQILSGLTEGQKVVLS